MALDLEARLLEAEAKLASLIEHFEGRFGVKISWATPTKPVVEPESAVASDAPSATEEADNGAPAQG